MLSSSFPENSGSSTGGTKQTRFGDGFGDNTRITAKNVAEEASKYFLFFEHKFKIIEPKINRLNKDVQKQSKELKSSRNDNVQSLAIFVGFFTFVSVTFTILPRVSNPFILLGIVLVLVACLAFFVLLLVWVLGAGNEEKITRKQIGIYCLIGFLLIIGLISAGIGYYDIKNEEYQNISEFRKNYYTQEQVDDLLQKQNQLLHKEMEVPLINSDLQLSKFKSCIGIRGLASCIAE